MSSKVLESTNAYNCAPSGVIAANEDIFDGDPATDVVSMENYETIVWYIIKNAGATGTATITVESCDDTTPSTATAIAFHYRATTSGNTRGAVTAATSAGFTTTAGANQIYEIEVSAEALSAGDKFVRMQCTEVANNPCDGAIMQVMHGPRFGHEDVTS